MSNYPTKEQLNKILNWRITSNKDLLDIACFVKYFWNWDEPYYKLSRRIKDRDEASVREGEYYRKLELSTGGWSGNEDIISALMENFIWWSMCFYSHHAGGHYVFRIYENRIEENKKK